MKIVSRYQDFYDWELSVSYDDTLIYNRDYSSKKIEKNHSSSDNHTTLIGIGNIIIKLETHNDFLFDRLSGYRSQFIKFCDDNKIFLESQEFKVEEDLRFHDGSNEKVSKTAKTGGLIISQPMKVWLSSFMDSRFKTFDKNTVDIVDSTNFRKSYKIVSPVFLAYNSTIHENISFMASGIDISLWMSSQEVAAEIDSYLQKTYDPELTVTSNDDRIVSNGFDLKTSFRHRK